MYFPAFSVAGRTFQDGAIVANNPSAIALHEARALYPGATIECLVSLGTGRRKPGVPERQLLAPQWFLTMKTLVRAATRTEDVHQLLSDTLPFCGTAYFRFNPLLEQKSSLDETSPEKLAQLQRIGRESVERGGCCADAMDELVRLIGAAGDAEHDVDDAPPAPSAHSASLDAQRVDVQ